MSELSRTLARLHKECDQVETTLKENLTAIHGEADDNWPVLDAVVSQLLTIAERINHNRINLKQCETEPDKPGATEIIQEAEDQTRLKRELTLRYQQLEHQVQSQRDKLAYLWDLPVELPSTSGSDPEPYTDQALPFLPYKDIVSVPKEHTAVGHNLRTSEDFSSDVRIAWTSKTRQEIESWKDQHDKHARELEQAVSRWNKDTEYILKAANTLLPPEVLESLARQKDLAKQLGEQDLEFGYESSRGPVSREKYNTHGLQSIRDLNNARRQMYENNYQASVCMDRMRARVEKSYSKAVSDPLATGRQLQMVSQVQLVSSGSPGPSLDFQSFQTTTDWSCANNHQVHYYQKRINTLTRRLEQKLSRWNQITETALRTEQWQKLREQQEKAEGLKESYLQLKTKRDQGPPPTDNYIIWGSQPERELVTAYTTMEKNLSDIVGVFNGNRGAVKDPNAGAAASQAIGGSSQGQQGVIARFVDKGDITFDSSACSVMSPDELKRWKHRSLEKTRRLERTICMWNKQSREIETEISTVPTGGALSKLEKSLEEAQRLETRCISLNEELSRGPSLAMHDGLGSVPMKRFGTARKVMNRQWSALKNISHKAQNCLVDFVSSQAQSEIEGTSHMKAMTPDYSDTGDCPLRREVIELD